MGRIVIIGALDTKGSEVAFVRDEIAHLGHAPVVMDVGILGAPRSAPSITREAVAIAAGTTIPQLVDRGDRGEAVSAMAAGATVLVRELHEAGRLDAVIGLGGGAGTSIATTAMRALPIGVPKVMVSTLAGGDVRAFVGLSDVVMVPALVDISGLNRLSRDVFTRAAAAVCAMAAVRPAEEDDRPVIAASMFGNTTLCVEQARATIEQAGYEVLVFHATGTGGGKMEALIDAGYISGVLDVTTTEWADELVGGVLTAGSTRLDAAARAGIPAVVAPGCLDMVNFWAPDSIPARFADRRFYRHNPSITLMRTTPEENAELGRIIAGKLNRSTGPVALYLPLRGLSVISEPGGPFHWPEADEALFAALRRYLRSDIPVHELDVAINHPSFSDALSEGLLTLLRARRVPGADTFDPGRTWT